MSQTHDLTTQAHPLIELSRLFNDDFIADGDRIVVSDKKTKRQASTIIASKTEDGLGTTNIAVVIASP